MLQQQVVHRPERALSVSGLGRLGTQRCVGVHIGQRQVSPDVSEVAEVGEKRAYDGLGPATVGALKVAVLHQGHLRIRRAADVVVFLINRHGQVYQRLGRAEQRAGPPGRRESSRNPEDHPGE